MGLDTAVYIILGTTGTLFLIAYCIRHGIFDWCFESDCCSGLSDDYEDGGGSRSYPKHHTDVLVTSSTHVPMEGNSSEIVHQSFRSREHSRAHTPEPSAPSEPNPPYPLEDTMPMSPLGVPQGSSGDFHSLSGGDEKRPIGFAAEVHNSAGFTPSDRPPSASTAPNPPYPIGNSTIFPEIQLRIPEVQPVNPGIANPPSYDDVMSNKAFYGNPQQK